MGNAARCVDQVCGHTVIQCGATVNKFALEEVSLKNKATYHIQIKLTQLIQSL